MAIQSMISLAVLVVVIAAGLREWPAVLEGPEPDLTAAAGLAPKLSCGLPIEEISRLVGHSSTAVTEQVYRHQIRPAVKTGAMAMDSLFGTS